MEQRLGSNRTMGFKASVGDSVAQANASLAQVIPDDLLKFGLIPEFIGRLPVMVSLDNLDRDALIRILTEPKNAIVKQYQKLMNLDRVELNFTPAALEAAADSALRQKTGARGLRTIIEEALLDVMFEAPSQSNVRRVTIEAETITRHAPATMLARPEPHETQEVDFDESA